MGRPPGETARIVAAQMKAWCWMDRAEEALETLLKVMQAAKEEIRKADGIVEGIESPREG